MRVAGADRGRLAVDGGEPVRRTLLPYGHQTVTEDDLQAVADVLRSDWITTGPTVRAFEAAFAAEVGAAHAVAFSSGTAALHGATFAAGLEPGDEAITTPLSFCATANCVLYQGATPVFADITDDTLNIDPDAIEGRITDRTKALIAVDFAGHPADLGAIRTIADRHGLPVIEDASHALGARYRGGRIGSLSSMTVFSFHPVKHLTTGEGGMVTTNEACWADRLRMFRNHGIDSDAAARQARGEWYYEMQVLGYNYRLSDIACALGLSQLRRLAASLVRRRAIADRYRSALSDTPGLRLPVVREDVEHAWHLFQVRIEAPGIGRDQVFKALRSEGIGVNVHYIPIHLHPYYVKRFGFGRGDFPGAERAAERVISLPLFQGMTDGDVDDVIAAVTKVMTVLSCT